MCSIRHHSRTAVLLCAAALISGCGGPVGDDVAAMREQILVAAPPDGAVPISEIKTKQSSGDLKPGSDVVIRARISAGEVSPWTEGRAAFIVTDATGHDGSENHDPHQCPFCRRDIRNHMALVRVTGEDGQLVEKDARELLGVSDGELLVVQGTIREAEADELAIDAQKVHLIQVK